MRLTVFTCIIGKTDPLRKPTVINKNVRYVLLTDKPLRVPPYETVTVPTGEDARLTSRRIKILANHPAVADADVTLWHDAAFRLDCDPVPVATKLLGNGNMVALRHPHRNTIEEEAKAIEKWGWVPQAQMEAQIAVYRADGFVQKQITSTGLCFRRRTPALERFNEFWWSQVERWGWRDQMSVDYALWKTGVSPTYIPGHYRDNKYAKWFWLPAVPPRLGRPAQRPGRYAAVAPAFAGRVHRSRV